MYKYSKSTNSFYPIELLDTYSNLPNDLVDVDESVFIEFTQQPPKGKQRGSDEKGFPVWVDLPPPVPYTQAQIEFYARAVRDDFLSKTDKMTLIDYSIRDVRLIEEQRNQLISCRDEFKKWPQSDNFPNLARLPEMPLWLFNEAISAGWNAPKNYIPKEISDWVEILQ